MPRLGPHSRYLIASAVCIATTALTIPLRHWIDLANIVMILLLAVLIIALRLGRGPAVMTAFLSVALFDFFFVPPHLTLSVADAQYLITFAVMLAVGLITSHLAAALAERSEAAQARERETRSLYELARHLGATLTMPQVAQTVNEFLAPIGLQGALLLATTRRDDTPVERCGSEALAVDAMCVSAAYRDDTIVETPPPRPALYLPLAGTTRVRGVLVIAPAATVAGTAAAVPIERPLCEAVASLTGVAVERIHYAQIAQQSELDTQTEKLRSSILSSISHDLRTPLTSLVGLADTLRSAPPPSPAELRDTATIIRDQAYAMHSMVSNLLELARVNSGRQVLNRQWQGFEEIVESSLRLLREALGQRRITIDLPDDLPLVEFDAVLIERVVCNLLENAAKYSSAGDAIGISARVAGRMLEVDVCNAGSRFPEERIEYVFDSFVRGHPEPAAPGTGIGLSVCKAIIDAHGGTIAARNTAGGACVQFALPLGTPPAVDGDIA